MLILAVALYFLLACLISFLVLFPAGRAFALRILARAGKRLRAWFGQAAQVKGQSVAAIRQSSSASAHQAGNFLRRHYLLVIGGLVLVSVPPLVALFSGGSSLGGFEESTRQVDTQVADLLEGENLVPPPPLPPMLFATVEVEQERPMIVSASRDWNLMNPAYTQRLLQAFKIMKERHGYDMAILEGYRSPERQNKLAAMGSSVTNAAAFQSWHQYGLAADCAFVRNGKIVISEKDPWAMRGYELYGEVAESLGLTWGGRWKMMDFGHTELRLPGVMKRR
ncbi:M15 family metallopeptidase [Massilia antarctica]|uniref:M15 family metallopeptidase n=1 Tax=Massilia antarctica TaxID=2765360 RepID=A0AA49A7B3_9BURK|nr:M15 family metallopeptidase [Massilia antarctica]QPI49233.1 M15 family metallopeptidase [Massilia antarctica]